MNTYHAQYSCVMRFNPLCDRRHKVRVHRTLRVKGTLYDVYTVYQESHCLSVLDIPR